jgi:hypothetical protein
MVARRGRSGDGDTFLVGALHGEEDRPYSHHDDHQQAWTRLIHMAQPLTYADPEDNARGRAHGRRRKRHRERPGVGGGCTDGSGSLHAQEGGSYLARKAWGGEEAALARRRRGGVLAACVELGVTVRALGKSVLQERAKASPTCRRWAGAG